MTIFADRLREDYSLRDLLGLLGSNDRARTAEDTTVRSRQPGCHASDGDGRCLSLNNQIASGLGSSIADGLRWRAGRDYGGPDSGSQSRKIWHFYSTVATVSRYTAAKPPDAPLRGVVLAKLKKRRVAAKERRGRKKNVITDYRSRLTVLLL